ncbi:HNH endonuclease signature motif containing protein [Marinilabilia salmonicolor]|uniref:Putative HNH nuclease YajD n=1 Tax=Marinilabilia salmonicolor TaxID=989 RepID=A0A368VEM9_9BACT|nr:HNH endonuclease signature motif containing protein [Marinilabilia salmonicolor]RCW38675.1 HNH endonuclease [Marinilabilia salmonicolor]
MKKDEFWWMKTEKDEKQKRGWTSFSQNGWYNTKNWRELRQIALAQNPLCELCKKAGRLTPAKEVNHIIPAEEDISKFFDLNNLQPLCSFHHRSITRRDNSKYSRKNLAKGKDLQKQMESDE